MESKPAVFTEHSEEMGVEVQTQTVIHGEKNSQKVG